MFVLADGEAVLKFPYSLEQLRVDNPTTSFPAQMSTEDLSGWGVFPVTEREPLEHDEASESLVRDAPALEDGEWVSVWAVKALEPEEIQRRSAAQAQRVRTERNRILAVTDYSQLPDYPGSSTDQGAIAEFRQALRDVPDQPGFPWAVVWPLPPEKAS
jgi:hypothetical protein